MIKVSFRRMLRSICYSRLYLDTRHTFAKMAHSPLLRVIFFSILGMCFSIYLGYYIGTLYLPKRSISPDRNVMLINGKINYSLYYTHKLTLTLKGDLGDQMFQYASLYGISRANGLRTLISDKSDLTDVFPHLSAQKVSSPTPGYGFPKFREHRGHSFDQRAFTINYLENIDLEGSLQSWRYFDHVRSNIREEFYFSRAVNNYIDDYIHNLTKSFRLQQPVTYVSLYVYKETAAQPVKGYVHPSMNFYKAVTYYFKTKYENVVFVVLTSDVGMLRSTLAEIKDVQAIYPDLEHSGLNLVLMSRCNHSIVTGGALGWWGAWLADGVTLYYKEYPKPGSELEKDFLRRDYYPPQWIPV